MSNVAKQKKKAAEFEAKRQFDKALAIYIEILDNFDKHPEEVDVALFNRVGDMLLRQGNVADAVDYYERAVDKYAEGGFFNNAIALCNKILRQSPGRSSIYYKLGKISAQKGFKNDAKQNFLEYADRMQKSGRMDEAFRALKEFADLCPDQDDIRLMLADQLSRQERGEEAIEQLQTLFDRYSEDGRDAEARATLDRIKAIDPAYEPRSTGAQRTQKGSDLVFLDVYAIGDKGGGSDAAADLPVERASEPEPIDLAPAPGSDLGLETTDAGTLSGLETTSYEPPPAPADGGLLDLEPTSFGSGPMDAVPPAADLGSTLDGLETTSFELPEPARASRPTPRGSTPIGGLDFLVPPGETDEAPEQAASGESEFEFLLPDSGSAAPAAPNARTSGEMLADMDAPFLQADAAPSVDFSGLDMDGASAVEPGTEASVPELDPGQPLDGLPLMDVEIPSVPAIDEERIRQSREIPQLTLEDEPDEGAADEIAVETPSEAAIAQAEDRTRRSTMAAEQSVELLAAMAESDPADFGLRRRLGEARLDSGDRDGGLADLDAAMIGLERQEDLAGAAAIADEIARITPDAVRIHQKRVEYAFRTNERPRLVGAYLDLASALLGDGQTEKARTVYKRVLDLSPDDIAAQAGLAALEAAAVAARSVEPAVPEPAAPSPVAASAATAPRERPRVSASKQAVSGDDDDSFVNLGDWLREDEGPKNTRMVVEEKEPTGDEEADFAEMLRRFKQGVADNVDAEDHQSHYDLGVAFKEMGLVDEAIAEFQKALRAPTNRLPTYEALGQCFVEKGQHQVAKAILARALAEQSVSDEQLIGVLYLMGTAAEALGQHDEALGYYQRVFVVDIQFRDVAERLTAVEQSRT